MARDHRSAYQRRNEAARAQGWASYGEQRNAQRLGYPTPGEYRAARATARARRSAIPENPLRPTRELRRGGEVAPLPGGRTGIVAPFTEPAIDGVAGRGPVMRGGVWQELRRYRPTRRVHIWIGAVELGGARGFTIGYLLSIADENGSLFWTLANMADNSYMDEMPDDPDLVSFTIS